MGRSNQELKAIHAKNPSNKELISTIKKQRPVITKKDIQNLKTNGGTLQQKLNRKVKIKNKASLKFPVTTTSDKFLAQLIADRKAQVEHPNGEFRSVTPKAKFEVIKTGSKFQVRSNSDVKKIIKQKGLKM